MSNFNLHLIKCLIVPVNVNVYAPSGLRCIVCNKHETFDVKEYLKNPAMKSRLDREWTNVVIPPYPGKHFCKTCTPPLDENQPKHKQGRLFVIAEENRRLWCLAN